MKQFQFCYKNAEILKRDMYKVTSWMKSNVTACAVFTVYSDKPDKTLIEEICSVIEGAVPNSLYFGCSTNGNIVEGKFSDAGVVIICTICEYPTTKAEVLQYHLTDGTVESIADDFLKKLEERPWVKFVEICATIRHTSLKPFGKKVQSARSDILMFGGGAFSENIGCDDSCVFSSAGGFTEDGIVLLLVGGEDIRATTAYITGWEPLCKEFRITKAGGCVLNEINGLPAYEVYNKYLNIENDENFFKTALEFPFFYEHNGIQILRAPMICAPDGSLILTGDIDENVSAHFAYGDPSTILDIVGKRRKKLAEFRPEAIKVFSCAVRRVFWGDDEISRETEPFCNIASTSGFYTSGEFLRTEGKMNLHNITLVLAAIREGEPAEEAAPDTAEEDDTYSGRASMINRLANFINVATNELEEANKKLAAMAVTDGLTKLYNRAEINKQIKERLKSGRKLSLVMLDIDNFKDVNDTYGHSEGDNVIISLAELLAGYVNESGPDTYAGRWGGEEFMLMLPCGVKEAEKAAEILRVAFMNREFPLADEQTVSLGVTEAIAGESADSLLVRVDKALYASKYSGKNRYTVL